MEPMAEVIFRSKLGKGVYYFELVVQKVNTEILQSVHAGTVIVKIKGDKISTHTTFSDYVLDNAETKRIDKEGLMLMAKAEAIRQAENIEKFINNKTPQRLSL